MKAFISSVIVGFESERDAAEAALETFGYQVIRAEAFPASPSSPRVACLAEVRQADIVVLLLGRRYGQVQPGGLSATHEEFRAAQGSKELIALVQDISDRESEQEEFAREVQDYVTGTYTASFDTTLQLERSLTKALLEIEKRRLQGPPNEERLIERATKLMEDVDDQRGYRGGEAKIVAVATGGYAASILRLKDIEGDELQQRISQRLLLGKNALMTLSVGTTITAEDDFLLVSQPNAQVRIYSDGSLVCQLPLERSDMQIVEEDVCETLTKVLAFFNDVLGHIDETEKLTHLVLSVRIDGASYSAWAARGDTTNRRRGIALGGFGDNEGAIFLRPAVRRRSDLRTASADIVDDFTRLLRRRFQQ